MAVTNEEKEREARFLVSDLLEIGMIQRQAYKEAREREAAERREGRSQADPATDQGPPAPAPTPSPVQAPPAAPQR